MRKYSELIKLTTFEQRFDYLNLHGKVGEDTFGFDRYLNQLFYHSREWKKVRREIIIRDSGCDLGVSGYEITGKIYIHHMNPMTSQDIEKRIADILDPEYLICVSYDTHNALHYGDFSIIKSREPIVRRKNDTCPWRC